MKNIIINKNISCTNGSSTNHALKSDLRFVFSSWWLRLSERQHENYIIYCVSNKSVDVRVKINHACKLIGVGRVIVRLSHVEAHGVGDVVHVTIIL